MQILSFVIAAAFSSIALAQSLSDLPACARTCAGSGFGGCGLLDVKCICSNADYISSLSCCIAQGCNADDQAKTIKFASDLCLANGITVATSATCASTSAPAGSSSGTVSAATTASSSSASGSSFGSVTQALTTAPTTSSAGAATAGSTGAAPLYTAGSGAGVGLGLAMAGLLVAL